MPCVAMQKFSVPMTASAWLRDPKNSLVKWHAVTECELVAALQAVSGSDCAICIMHKQGSPQTMQRAPRYADVVSEVHDYLLARIAWRCLATTTRVVVRLRFW